MEPHLDDEVILIEDEQTLHLSASNSTGYMGVSKRPNLESYRAEIYSGNGKRRQLGSFPTALSAAKAYAAANRTLEVDAARRANEKRQDRLRLPGEDGLYRSAANCTGFTGVSRRNCGGFRAEIILAAGKSQLGNFETAEAAAQAYAKAKEDSGFGLQSTSNTVPLGDELIAKQLQDAFAPRSSRVTKTIGVSRVAAPVNTGVSRVAVPVNTEVSRAAAPVDSLFDLKGGAAPSVRKAPVTSGSIDSRRPAAVEASRVDVVSGSYTNKLCPKSGRGFRAMRGLYLHKRKCDESTTNHDDLQHRKLARIETGYPTTTLVTS